MYWIDFKKYFGIVGLLFLMFSCSFNETTDEKPVVEVEGYDYAKEMSESYIKRQIESNLQISAAEDYDVEITYTYINPDTIKDALILVNRKDYALTHVKNSSTERFFEKTGETGPYNYVFVKIGGKKNIISTTPVGSNINYNLKATFLELTSKAYKDFYVEYRIRNSLQRNYYTVRNNTIYLTFSCPVFDQIGEEKPRVYDIRHESSSVRLSKDIAMYHAKIKDYNPNEITAPFHYEPKEIIASDDLYVYFIFDEKTMKFVTPMKSPESEE